MLEQDYKAIVTAQDEGRYNDVLDMSQGMAKDNPQNPMPFYFMGAAYHGLYRLEEAETCLRRFIEYAPKHASARLQFALVLRKRGKVQEAESVLKALIHDYPEEMASKNNYAYLLNELGRHKESAAMLEKLYNKGHKDDATCINLGIAMQGLNDFTRARALFEEVLKRESPHVHLARSNIAACDLEEGRSGVARDVLLELHNKGLAPAEGYLNLATLSAEEADYESAVNWLDIGREKGLDSSKSVCVYADCQSKMGKTAQALQILQDYLLRRPDSLPVLLSWHSAIMKGCVYTEWPAADVRVLQTLAQGDLTQLGFGHLFNLLATHGISPKQHLKLARAAAPSLPLSQRPFTWSPPKEVKKRLKIGYLSADFRDHPVAHLMIGVFRCHDKEAFETYGYNIGKDDDSIYRYRSIGYLDHFYNAKEMRSLELAQRIHDDGIDVLIDLCGYTEHCKPAVLAYKPAPVIISYLGFVGTTGLEAIDYIIADDVVMPRELAHFYTEKPVYIPRCYQATDGTLQTDTSVTRTEMGLPEEAFVFASFNNSYKLNPHFMNLWANILLSCPDAVLWLYADKEEMRSSIIAELERLGVANSRVYFFSRTTKGRFLGALSCAHCFLDSSPYNAGTTASDALFAGCPVLTLPGEIYASRMAASIVTHAGLPELVCSNKEDYVAKAVALYADKEHYAAVRARAEQAKNTRLFDTADATRCLEAAYRAAYARFAAGKQTAHIRVEDTGWEKNEAHQRPFAGEKLLPEELSIIEKKLEPLRDAKGQPVLEHFRKLCVVSQPVPQAQPIPEAQPAVQEQPAPQPVQEPQPTPEAQPASQDPSESVDVAQCMQDGVRLLQEGNLDEAYTSYMRILAVEPHNAQAMYNLGVGMATLGKKYDEALVLMKQAVVLEPANAIYTDNLTQLLRHTNGTPYYLEEEVFDTANGHMVKRFMPTQSSTYIYNFDVAGMCNLRCSACPQGNYPSGRRNMSLMSLPLFQQIMEKIKTEGIVHRPMIWLYNWGEPTLNPQLPEMIACVKDYGMPVMLSSNLNVDADFDAIMKAAPDEFKISLSGYSQSCYGQTHRKGHIDLVKSHMYRLKYLKEKYAVSTNIWVGYHVYKHNYHEQAQMSALCNELGFGFNPIAAYYPPIENSLRLLHEPLSEEQQSVLGNFLIHPLDAIEANIEYSSKEYDCELRFNMTIINEDGMVDLCCNMFDSENSLGVPFLEKSHKELEALKYNHPLCKKCYELGGMCSPRKEGHEAFLSAKMQATIAGMGGRR